MILVFLGAPGSGKGTQAIRISKRKGWPQLSTGDMLRTAVAQKTALGIEAQRNMESGSLVPDSVVTGLISERISRPDCSAGFILDGFPRTIAQAEALEGLLKEKVGKSIGKVILFEVTDSEVVSRISGRRSCGKCGAVYHIESNPPRTSDLCDQCGSSPLLQRSDDRAEVVSHRLSVYREQTAPLVDWYKKRGNLHALDAMKSPEQVEQAIMDLLR